MNRITTALVVAFAFLLGLGGTALAASGTVAVADAAGAEATSVFDLLAPVLNAARSGNGWLAAALALVVAVGLAKKYLAPRGGRWQWLNGKAGGAAANVVLSFGAAAAAALTAGTAPSWALAFTALKVSIGAAGGFTLLKELVAPGLRWIESKVPAFLRPWVAPVFNLVCSLFEKPGAAAIAKAEAAGKAAVEAKPADGLAGVVGKTDELR